MTESEILLLHKVVLRTPVWHPRSNHAGHLIAASELLDSTFTTIPGVTVQLEVKAPVIVDACLYLFSIMRYRAKRREPIYQLEVAPAWKRTHNGVPPIYGPHVHVGRDAPVPVVDSNVHCGDWEECLKWFFEHARIQPFSMDNPEHVRL